MMKIYKYEILIAGFQIMLPSDAKVLKIDLQNNDPYMWILLDTNKSTLPKTFRVYGTGQTINAEGLRYIDTFQQDGFVWHVFEEL